MEQYYSKLTTKCQAVIPKEVREVLNLKEGDYVIFEVEGKKVEIKKGKIIIETEG